MTSISSSLPPERVVVNKGDQVTVFRQVEQDPKITAEIAKMKAAREAALAADKAFNQQLEQKNSLKNAEKNDMYLPNIADLSLDVAKSYVGIERVTGADVKIHGGYGDKEITDMKTWAAALKDYISKKEAALGTPEQNKSSNSSATSAYRQIQNMGL